MKKRIAVWTHGGVGTGHFSQGYPLIEKLLIELSADLELTIYSHVHPNIEYRSDKFTIRSVPLSIKSSSLRWIVLTIFFIKDHIAKRYHALFAFWGYPAGVFSVVLGKFFRIPIVVNLLGGDSVGIESIRYGIMCNPRLRKISLWAYERATVLTVLSIYQADALKKFGLKKQPVVIPWGAEAKAFPFQIKKWSESLKIIHVASLNEVKDQTTLVMAFNIIRKKVPASLRIIGADYLDGRIQNLCSELGLTNDVEFLGMIPYAEMPSHYEWAEIMMHTSLSEGQSLALTEAATSGVLLAGTQVGLVADLGEDGAISVEPGDYVRLAEKIISSLTDESLRTQKIKFARLWAEEHDLHWTVNQITLLIANL